LGKRVPQVDQYDTQIDRYNFLPPRTAEQIAADKEKQAKYLTDYDSNSTNPKQAKKAHSTDYESNSTNPRQTKETHSTDEELNKEASTDTSIIRNSPIGTRPRLTPTILTAMSTTTTQPTITVQAATTTATVTHGLLVRFCLLCGDRTAYCTDMGSCESGLPFLEPFVILLVLMRTSDGGLPI